MTNELKRILRLRNLKSNFLMQEYIDQKKDIIANIKRGHMIESTTLIIVLVSFFFDIKQSKETFVTVPDIPPTKSI